MMADATATAALSAGPAAPARMRRPLSTVTAVDETSAPTMAVSRVPRFSPSQRASA